MFDDISPKYDFLNHLLSFGIDKSWRKRLRKELEKRPHNLVLDLATGTGDLAIELSKISDCQIIGGDISAGMLAVGKQKIASKGLANRISMELVDSEKMPFPDAHFDSVTISYGIRNFGDLEKGLTEMCRVTKSGGSALILEFSTPRNKIFAGLFSFYFKYILPVIGRIFSKHIRAYTYLPESVASFPDGEKMVSILKNCGYAQVSYHPLTFGITTLYLCQKS